MRTLATAEALLELLFWSLEQLSRPTFANLTETFEAWEHRARIQRHLRSLTRSGYITVTGRGNQRTLKLTKSGRSAVAGGNDPQIQWARKWDGCWRVLIFDLPASDPELRMRLWRWLRSQRFGYLQQSAWISPDPVDDSLLPVKHLQLSVENYTVIEGNPALPDRDEDLVRGAWNFEAINGSYANVISLCRGLQREMTSTTISLEERNRWLVRQRQAWLEAVSLDPLLPEKLWPVDYLGNRAYRLRQEVIGQMVKDYR
jgi:phenylacetic acid degradation operon negative regulatory protein